MKCKEKALSARNLLLEKLLDLNKRATESTQPATPAPEEQNLAEALGFDELPGPVAQLVVKRPHLTLTIPAVRNQIVPIQNFAKMPLSAYAQLHTAYVRQLGSCLTLLEGDRQADNAANPVLQQLEKWALECGLLLIATGFSSPQNLQNLYHCNFAEGMVVQHELPESFYNSLLVALNHSEAQVQDLLYLRQLFYGKLGQLRRQRDALLQRLEGSRGRSSPLDQAVHQANIVNSLQQNAAEEYRTVLQFAGAYNCGVHTLKQWATTFVFSYPQLPMHTSILEVIAAKRGGEPSQADLEMDTSVTDAQHASNWEDIVTYLTTVDASTVRGHVPLLPQ